MLRLGQMPHQLNRFGLRPVLTNVSKGTRWRGVGPFARDHVGELGAARQGEIDLCAVFGAQVGQARRSTQAVLLVGGVSQEHQGRGVFKQCAHPCGAFVVTQCIAFLCAHQARVVKIHFGRLLQRPRYVVVPGLNQEHDVQSLQHMR